MAALGREIRLPGGASAYAALPETPRGGVVVLHELFGRAPEMERVVERFAARGHAAVLPWLFESPTSVLRPRCIRAITLAMRDGTGPFADEVKAARAWLCERTGLGQGQVGLIGFCLGGGFALALGQGWGAVSTNYGDLPPDARLDGLPPTIGCYGGRDPAFHRKGEVLEQKLRARGIEVETHLYPQVGHSFLTDGEHPIARVLTRPALGMMPYDAEVAEDAWAKIFAFFDRHLLGAG